MNSRPDKSNDTEQTRSVEMTLREYSTLVKQSSTGVESNRTDAERPSIQAHTVHGIGRIRCHWPCCDDPIPHRTGITFFESKK